MKSIRGRPLTNFEPDEEVLITAGELREKLESSATRHISNDKDRQTFLDDVRGSVFYTTPPKTTADQQGRLLQSVAALLKGVESGARLISGRVYGKLPQVTTIACHSS